MDISPTQQDVGEQRSRNDAGNRRIVVLTAALWLASFLMCFALLATPVSGDNTGLMKLTESYGALERVALWQRALSWFPGGDADGTFTSWPKPIIVWTVRVSLATMFIAHALAFLSVWRSRSGSVVRWLIGPIGAQIIMLLMVPSNADVFFYEISGDLANAGVNPYTTHLYEAFQHPIYPYNHWVDMTTVYGPVWTMINQALMWIAGPDPTLATLAYKVLFGVVAILVALGVHMAACAMGVARHRAVAAAVLVAWQPNMIIEAAGQAHNDVVVIAVVFAAVMLTILGASRATRGGIILTTLSAAIKYVSLPVIGLLALTRLDRRHQRDGRMRIARSCVLDLVAIAATLIAVFVPYWAGPSMLSEMVSEPGRLYSNPIWLVPASAIALIGTDAGEAFEAVTRVLAQVVSIIAILYVIWCFAGIVWIHAGRKPIEPGSLPYWTRPLIASWALIFGILAFVPVNTHPWYWTWPVVPIALLVVLDTSDDGSRRPPHRWFVPWLVLTAVMTLIYHTRIVHM